MSHASCLLYQDGGISSVLHYFYVVLKLKLFNVSFVSLFYIISKVKFVLVAFSMNLARVLKNFVGYVEV